MDKPLTRTNLLNEPIRLGSYVLLIGYGQYTCIGYVYGFTAHKVRVVYVSTGYPNNPSKGTVYADQMEVLNDILVAGYKNLVDSIQHYVNANGIKLDNKNSKTQWYCFEYNKVTRMVRLHLHYNRKLAPSLINANPDVVYIAGDDNRYLQYGRFRRVRGSRNILLPVKGSPLNVLKGTSPDDAVFEVHTTSLDHASDCILGCLDINPKHIDRFKRSIITILR